MAVSAYYIRGRLFPTILTIIPLLFFVNVIVVGLYYDNLKEILNVLPIITNLGLSAALIFLMVQINRLAAKEVFQRFYFQDETYMPTTDHLLWSDNYFDIKIKEMIRLKIQTKFGITLMSEIEEAGNELKSRNQIATAVSQIRNSLRDNKILMQHNIEYGFFRNLLGGCVFALIFSIIILGFGLIKQDYSSVLIGSILIIFYLIPILFSRLLIKRFGYYYSKILYEQFLSI